MVYFDNAASTKPLQKAVYEMSELMINNYVNPASMSKLGMEVENIIISSRKAISTYISCDPCEIYFTSGGTESNNWAIIGTVSGYHRNGKHIITTNIEHPAILLPFQNLEEAGFEVTYLAVDDKGYINLNELKESIRQDTILVSVMLINNEVGTIQKIDEIGKLVKEKNSSTIFHVDGVQAFGKYKINVLKSKIDMLTISGHKFHAPKGTGILYLKKGLKVKPFMYGGGHQLGMRAGTENAAGAAAIAIAAQEAYENLNEYNGYVKNIKKVLWEGINNTITETYLNGENIEEASPYLLNITFKGIRSEVLLHALEEKGIYVSSGSACNSKKKNHSHVLEAMGLEEENIKGAIRFSFSRFNTLEEVNYCVKVLNEIVPLLRKYNR